MNTLYVFIKPNTTDQKLDQLAKDVSKIYGRKVRVAPLGGADLRKSES